MRQLLDHKVTGLNEAITVNVLDEPGQGGACHEYGISIDSDGSHNCHIWFQNGPVKESGVNGISQEALLAVIIDRLRSFQAGPFSTRENSIALTKCEEALLWLHKRTHDRLVRGVEGTNQK